MTNKTREDIIAEATNLVNAVEDILPLKVNEITNPDQNPIIATVRKADGYPAIQPHPESVSMLTGDRAVFQLFVFAPRIIRELLDLLEEDVAAPDEEVVQPVQKPRRDTGVSLPE